MPLTSSVGSRTAWVVSIVPWVRTPWVAGQWAPTASVGGLQHGRFYVHVAAIN